MIDAAEIPMVHIGGTPKSLLLHHYNDARASLRDALAALNHASPNGRDWVGRPEADFQSAHRAHAERCDTVRRFLAELDALAEAVADQETSWI
ncbi:MAG: hypothetical protein V3S29_13200 [bacterium]